MTLADLLRNYLNERRKVCEEKARFLDLGRDVLYYSRDGENTSSSDTSNTKKYFSNTLEKTPNDEICKDCKKSTIKTQRKLVTRMVKRPDGKIQTETIVSDGKGNEVQTISYQENGKTYTTIKKTDPSGNEKVEHKVTNASGNAINSEPVIIFPDQFVDSYSSDNDYDYWFNKFFGSEDHSQVFPKIDMTPNDFNQIDQINKLLKMFGNDIFSGPFTNQQPPDGQLDDADFASKAFEDTQRIIDQFENHNREFDNKKSSAYKNEPTLPQVESIMKNFLTPKKPGLFEQFSERAIVEVPEEKTPFDKYIDDDEETKKKRLSILHETSEYMKKLNSYFEKKSTDDRTDIYSDIQPSKDDDFAIFVPKPNPPIFNDFANIVPRLSVSTSSKMRFPNGNLRTEQVKKDNKGNLEKTVTYEVGKKFFTLVTVTSPSGQIIQRQRKLNFSENELNEFKKQWDKRFQSDFSE